MKNILIFSFSLYFQVAGAQVLEDTEQSARAVEFLHHLTNKKFTEASQMFDANVAAKLDSAKLAQTWMMINSQAGPFKGSKGLKSEILGGYRIITISCQFESTELDLRTSFDEVGKINGVFFLPPKPETDYIVPKYVKLKKFREKEVYFKADDFLIPGTLSLPKRGKKLPIVILVHGSGPLDRDATIGPNKIFKDIAWGLASKNVAVIRYDKRTFIYPAKMAEIYGNKFTVMEETVSDAIAAAKFAQSLGKIDPAAVFIAGHSLGGMLAPRIARMKTGLAGIIIMAGNARPLEDLILEQLRHLNENGAMQVGFSNSENLRLEKIEKQVAMVKNPYLNVETPSTELPLNIPAKYWLDLKNYNAVAAAKNARLPLLFLQGERDYQVTMTDFMIWKKELREHPDVEFKVYSSLNHLFLEGAGMSTPKEYLNPGSVPEYLIKDIVKWIKLKKRKK